MLSRNRTMADVMNEPFGCSPVDENRQQTLSPPKGPLSTTDVVLFVAGRLEWHELVGCVGLRQWRSCQYYREAKDNKQHDQGQ